MNTTATFGPSMFSDTNNESDSEAAQKTMLKLPPMLHSNTTKTKLCYKDTIKFLASLQVMDLCDGCKWQYKLEDRSVVVI